MKNLLKASLALALIYITLPAFAKSKCDAKAVAKIEKAFASGKGVVLVAWGPKQKCVGDDESCGDWADNLNTFAQNEKSKIEIIKVSSSKWPGVVSLTEEKIPEQSSLFMAKKHASYFYKGPIVEGQVYQAVYNTWFARPDNQDSAFMPEKIEAHLCK